MRRDEMLEHVCAECGYRMDAASDARGSSAVPKAGDLSICLGCGLVEVWVDVQLNVRRAYTTGDANDADPADIEALECTLRARAQVMRGRRADRSTGRIVWGEGDR